MNGTVVAILLAIGAVLAALFVSRKAGKDANKVEVTEEVLDNVSKAKEVQTSISSASSSDVRDRLRKYSK